MRLVSVLGLFVLLGIAWLMSNQKNKIRGRVIFWGVGLQLLFAVIILSDNILSMAGMFVLLCLVLFYIFADRIAGAGTRQAQALYIAGIVMIAVVAAATSFFAAQIGLAVYMAAAALLAAVWARISKRPALMQYAIGAFLTIGYGIGFAKEWYGRVIMAAVSAKVDSFLRLTDLGSQFLFGNLADPEYFGQFGFQFAFAVLPTIIFFAAFMSILYYFGIIQVIVETVARFMRWTIGTSGAETLSCSANIFVGQTEAPLLIKPYLQDMTISELATIMIGGFATIAGGVLAGYIRLGVDPSHLIAASVMSAPAALVIGKIIFPETEHSKTAGDVKMPDVQTAGNLLEAASNGIIDGLKLAVNVGAMLIGFIALMGFVDVLLNFLDKWIDGRLLGGELVTLMASPFSPVSQEYTGIFPGSLRTLFGEIFRYIAFIMGTPWKDSVAVGNLLGLKIAVNEFVAYGALGQYIADGVISDRAETIATYALCGFANFASIGIQIGGIGAIAPNRRKELAKVAFKAMIGGAIASWMTATIAGILL